MRCQHFIRPLHEQSSQNLHIPDAVYGLLTPRLKHMMGVSQYNKMQLLEGTDAPLGELSMAALRHGAKL